MGETTASAETSGTSKEASKPTEIPLLSVATARNCLAGDKLILPGVGAFQECWRKLSWHFGDALKPLLANKPVLGICVRMQVVFEYSLEHGKDPGLGLLKGSVEKIRTHRVPVPHVGWNQLNILKGRDTLFKGIPITTSLILIIEARGRSPGCSHPSSIVIAVIHDNLYATQFHLEKSQHLGLKVLQKFVRYC